jgi:organic hydroperoxide reductase OsmC/OhrA
MSKEGQFTIELDHLEGYEFKIRFDLQDADDLLVDEPPPLGAGSGPNPSRLLAAAAANCLSASLLYCVSKNDPPAGSLHTRATCTLERTEKGRLRVGGIQVTLTVDKALETAVRMQRCLSLFEDFCVVTASLRDGIPVAVEVVGESGETLHRADS